MLYSSGLHNTADMDGADIERAQKTMTKNMSFSGPILDKIQTEMESLIPLDKLKERRQRRDRWLAALSKLIKKLDEEDNDK